MKKQILLILILFVSSLMFTACNKDDNPTEPNDDDNGNSTEISGKLSFWNLGSDYSMKMTAVSDNNDEFIVAESSISADGSFSLANLKDIPSNMLYLITDGMPDSISCSNRNMKVFMENYFYIYNDSSMAGIAFAGGVTSDNSNEFIVLHFYSDSDGTITGSYTEYGIVYTYDMTISAGWNAAYGYDTDDTHSVLTTTKPGEIVWSFYAKKDASAILGNSPEFFH